MKRETRTRRTVLATLGSVAVLGSLAGCSGGDGGNGGGGGGGDPWAYPDADQVGAEPDYGNWFDDVDNYDATLDLRGRDSITIGVGTEDGYAYSPPAVLVDAGTTVVWEWTGNGGLHDVTGEDNAFQSEQTDQAGFQFSETLSDPGTYRYVCTPHESMGMKGAIVVE